MVIAMPFQCFSRPLSLFSFLFVSSCLYTSHNYQTGEVLKGGQSSVTVGYGRQKLVDLVCNDPSGFNTGWSELVKKGDKSTCRHIRGNGQSSDTSYFKPVKETANIPSMSFGYALGIRDGWGPFPGLDMGFQIELPTLIASVEFFARLALPSPWWQKSRHSVSLGYIIGAWSDNSYYLGYALSYKLGKHLVYANLRSTLMATQLPDIEAADVSETEFKFPHKRRLINQLSAGFMWTLPELKIIPDFATPQVNILYPNIPLSFDANSFGHRLGGFNVKWNIGLGWKF